MPLNDYKQISIQAAPISSPSAPESQSQVILERSFQDTLQYLSFSGHRRGSVRRRERLGFLEVALIMW